MGQENLLQLPAKSSRVATANKRQVHQEETSYADTRIDHSNQHERSEVVAGRDAEGQDFERNRGNNPER